ncbi:MAG TPA: DNA alkylation repair protein [Symbiobacteriaceae bacterium]|nr:DNA alkylation repair protein [Symbiobacteriaceae bacterium]
MTFAEVMQTLESLGTEQNRKIYGRHGGGSNMFGVSWAEIRKLAKKIKQDHALAVRLWESGSFEAMVIATMVADPKALQQAEVEDWVRALKWHAVTDEFVNNLISKTAYAGDLALAWIGSPAEQVGRAGWHLVGVLAKSGRERLDYAQLLTEIEQSIHTAPNRKREAMNNALIAIGIYRPELTASAIAAAGRIGKVAIDHGDTSCKTPDAAAYIQKALARPS